MKLKIGELSPTASGTAPPATHTIPLQTLYYLSCILSYTHIHFFILNSAPFLNSGPRELSISVYNYTFCGPETHIQGQRKEAWLTH